MTRSARPYCPTHDWHHDPDVDRTWAVYYCWAEDGTCLYVGLSDDVERRLFWHACYSGSGAWYPYTARVEESAPMRCRFDAHALEVAEIARLRPAFNKHHNAHPTSWTAPAERLLGYREIPPVTPFDQLEAKSA